MLSQWGALALAPPPGIVGGFQEFYHSASSTCHENLISHFASTCTSHVKSLETNRHKNIWSECVHYSHHMQTSIVGATLLAVVDQYALNVLGDTGITSSETFGKFQCRPFPIISCVPCYTFNCRCQNRCASAEQQG